MTTSQNTTPFTTAYVALLDGHDVRVKDRTGRLGTIVAMGEADPAERVRADVLVAWDKGNATTIDAAKFNRDFVVIVVPKRAPR